MNQRVVVYARRERRPRYNHPFHSKIVSFGLRNSPDLHNVISQIVQNAKNRPTSYQAPRSTYLVPVPSQPQPLVITIPSASFFAPKVPKILTLRPIPKPMVITYPPSKGPITISLLEPNTGNHAVPWNYGIEATTEQGEKSPSYQIAKLKRNSFHLTCDGHSPVEKRENRIFIFARNKVSVLMSLVSLKGV
ncbi:unnamed protein product [Vicia faba]|uniref:Uncharacterized protein n=1 Tax=Vicia faba TaxID=3906 RepID=A0AAV1ADF7_VICFA|nr:unnamed protein product [Vicia faba]